MTPSELKKALFKELMAYSTKETKIEILNRKGEVITKAEQQAIERQPITKAVRKAVMLNCGIKCHYCGFATRKGGHRHIDHRNGDRSESTVENLVVACRPCNTHKSNKPYIIYIEHAIVKLEAHLKNLRMRRDEYYKND